MRSRLRIAVLCAAVGMALAGCSGDPVTGHPQTSRSSSGNTTATPRKPGGTITFGETTEFPKNLQPLIADGNTTAVGNLVVRVLPGLYRTAPDITYSPDTDQGTATSSVSGGRQVVDIKINPKAVWGDGQPVTAADYAFTIDTQRSLDPAKGGCASLLSSAGFDQVQKVDQVGEKEVRVTFSTPYADWQGLFSGTNALLLSKHVFDQGSARATCDYITRGWPVAQGIPLGAQNGPWLLTASGVDTGTRTVTLVPNPRYWGDKPRAAKLVVRTIGSDSSAALTALQSGSLDMVAPLPQVDLLAKLKQIQGVTTELDIGSTLEHLDFNTRDPLLKYRQVRQAIALAIDRTAVVRATVGQFTDRIRPAGNRLLLDNQRGHIDHSGQYTTQNVAKAKQLIQSVGGKLGSDGIYRIGKRALSFRVMTTQGNALRDRTVAVIAQQAKAAGIKLTEFANPDIFYGPDRPTSLEAGGFQIALFAWLGSASVSSLNSIYLSPSKGGLQNYTRGGTSAVDAQLIKVATASSPDEQRFAANNADSLLWSQMYTLPLYQKPDVLAYRDRISGVEANPTLAGPLWNSDDLSVK